MMISDQDLISEKKTDDIILRRIFILTHLHTINEASFRIELNPDRTSECATAEDYTRFDYNYVTLKRKTPEMLIASIAEQPGPKLEHATITKMINRFTSFIHVPLASYILDAEHARLVRKEGDEKEKRRPVVIIDVCPRTQCARFSFLISLLKIRMPDLMGDSRIADLFPQVAQQQQQPLAQLACIACGVKRSDCIMIPCNHIVLCFACSTELQPQECLLCQKEVKKYERVYYA